METAKTTARDVALSLDRALVATSIDIREFTPEQLKRWEESGEATRRVLESSYILTGKSVSFDWIAIMNAIRDENK